jgi:hypothetical protein
MVGVAQLNPEEQYITSTIKNSIAFKWTKCTECLLQHQGIIDCTVTDLMRIYIARWCKQTHRLMSKDKKRDTKRKMNVLAHQ